LIEQNIGIRTHGLGRRADPQKSLRLYAREEYGNGELHYPFFDQKPYLDSFKTLILRTVKDWSGTLFKDEMCHRMIQNLDVDYMAGQSVIVFINGEYWGIQSLRERQDEYYIRSNHQIDGSDFDIIEYAVYTGLVVDQGDDMEYNRLLTLLESLDLSDDNAYEEVCEFIDIQNFIDYYIAELYFAHKDFPENNVKLWKPRDTEGKWRLLFFDCDRCMIRTIYDHISEYLNTSEYLRIHEDWATFIFTKLHENQGFRDTFFSQFCSHLNSTFHPDTVIRVIDNYRSMYRPLMPEHIYRWQIPNEMVKWEHNTSMLTQFAIQRPSRILLQLVKNFGNPINIYPNPSDGRFSIQSRIGDSDEIYIEITSVSGVRLYSDRITTVSGIDIPVKINLPEGIYLLSMRNKSIIFTEKLFIRR